MRTGDWYWFISEMMNQRAKMFRSSLANRPSSDLGCKEDRELAMWIYEELYYPAPPEISYEIRDNINEMIKKMYQLM